MLYVYIYYFFVVFVLPSLVNKALCYVATKFCENILIGVGDVTAKRNLQACPISG